MTCFWLLGLVLSISHHCYYAALDGEAAADQKWVIRIGTGIAFLAKSSFAASLRIALKQLVWTIVRHKPFSVKGIDALFAITSDPMSIFVAELWKTVPTIAIFAVLLWSIAIAAVVTPASMSVAAATVLATQACEVPTLNFGREYDWRSRPPQLARATFSETADDFGDASAPWKDLVPREFGYGGPSPFAEKLLRKVFIGSEILPFPSVCGANCTYRTTFPGIGYQCKVLDPDSTNPRYLRSKEIWTEEEQQPIYLGLLTDERKLIAYVQQQETRNGETIKIEEYFGCIPHQVTYELSVAYTNNIRRIEVISETVLKPVWWPLFLRNSTLSATYDETNFWAYQALADVVGQNLRGAIWLPSSDETESSTTLSYTSLTAIRYNARYPNMTVLGAASWPKLDFRLGIVELVRNLSISLLAETSLYLYDTNATQCEVTTYFNRWTYSPEALWPAYAAVLWVCTIGLGLGLLSIYMNGCSSEMSFSRVMCTTRNAVLDQAAIGSRFGHHPLPPELEKLRLQFGELVDENHAGFGVEEQIVPLQRRKCEQRLA